MFHDVVDAPLTDVVGTDSKTFDERDSFSNALLNSGDADHCINELYVEESKGGDSGERGHTRY